jgi:hypothetical protein
MNKKEKILRIKIWTEIWRKTLRTIRTIRNMSEQRS